MDFVVGVMLLGLSGVLVLGRERIVAGHRRRRGRAAQPPMAWLVLGVILGLCGLIEVVLAFA